MNIRSGRSVAVMAKEAAIDRFGNKLYQRYAKGFFNLVDELESIHQQNIQNDFMFSNLHKKPHLNEIANINLSRKLGKIREEILNNRFNSFEQIEKILQLADKGMKKLLKYVKVSYFKEEL